MTSKERLGVLKIFVLAIGFGFLSRAATLAQQLYWTDGNLFAIKRAPLAGGAATVVLDGRNYTHLAYDPMARMLYHAVADPVPMLYRCDPDGSHQELLLTLDTHNYVRGMAIDPVGGKIYWSSSDGYVAGNGKIRRANLDGSGVEDLVVGMIYPYGMAIDMATGKMFWIRQEQNSIWRANLDGSNAESLIPLGPSSYAFCLAVDTANARLYWTDPGNSMIGSANLDGTDAHSIAALDRSSLDAGITVDGGPQGQWRSIGADRFSQRVVMKPRIALPLCSGQIRSTTRSMRPLWTAPERTSSAKLIRIMLRTCW